MSPTIAIAGGYTAGHLTPGFAIVQEFMNRSVSTECLFIGSGSGPERRIVEAEGIRFCSIPTAPFSCGGTVSKARAIAVIPRSASRAAAILRSNRVTGLVLLGGHTSVGPAIAALRFSIPIYIIEPNASFGLANRLFVRFAECIFIGDLYADTVGNPNMLRMYATGVPVRNEIRTLHGRKKDPPIHSRPVRILILGGSLGHGGLNMRIPAVCRFLADQGMSLDVHHQCGVGADTGQLTKSYEDLGLRARVSDYIGEIHLAYSETDLAITAAGAITLSELACAGIPSVIIPLSGAAASHQKENARTYSRRTGSPVILEKDLSGPTLYACISDLIADPALWNARSQSMYDAARPDAAGLICKYLLREH